MSTSREELEVDIQRVLLVEDNPIDQRRLRRTFESLFAGVEVVVSGSVAAAKESLGSAHFDVAMVDWQLPDGHGDEVLQVAVSAEVPVPVVMMTGGDASDAERTLSQGAQDFISKGVDRKEMPNAILRAVRYAVSRAQADMNRKNEVLARETQERSEALARLAAGVAHDLNNTLAVVSMNLELLSTMLGTLSQDAAECLDSAREGAQAAAERCAQLRTYTGSLEVKSHPVDMAELVRTIFAESQVPLIPRVDAMGGESAMVRGDDDILRTLIARLTRGAMELGALVEPVVSIDIPTNEGAGQWVLPPMQDASEQLRIRLGWRGDSVPLRELRLRFDPFGEGAHGASLDLGECVGFVRAHSGALSVHSNLDGGSFDVWMPRWSHGPARPASPMPRRRSGALRVWVVDDEPLVLRVMVRLLQIRGLEVEAFSDGHDAYMAALEGDSCDVLVTDLLMPGMGGAELIDLLRADGWTQPVIVVTGYSDKVSSLSSTDGLRVLLKPFTNEELFEAIDETLGEEH